MATKTKMKAKTIRLRVVDEPIERFARPTFKLADVLQKAGLDSDSRSVAMCQVCGEATLNPRMFCDGCLGVGDAAEKIEVEIMQRARKVSA